MLGLMRQHASVTGAYFLQVYLLGLLSLWHTVHADASEYADTSRERYLDYSTCRLHRTIPLLVSAHVHYL